MDLLKTLLVYMTLTFATTVQGAPTPAPTEAPTAAPSAMTETVDTPAPEAEAVVTPEVIATITATAAPTLTPAPAPTMSPNPSYKLLKQGSRGDRVKKLQERLIELGYLSGEADGAYGNQTRRAVQRFQYYNGLQQDGEAGKATQTVLFESETVVSAATPTPTVTEAPTQTAEPPVEQTIEPPAAATDTPSPTVVPPVEAAASTGIQEQTDSKMVVNGAGEALHSLVMVDGVRVDRMLPVYTDEEGEPLLDVAGMAACLEGWHWTADETNANTYQLEVDGYMLDFSLTLSEDGDVAEAALTVDGEVVELAAGDVRRLPDGTVLVRAAVFENAIGASYVWDEEENTLMLNYVNKTLTDVQG